MTVAVPAATHRALIYETKAKFIDEVCAFLSEGVRRGEHLAVMVGAEKAEWVRSGLGRQAGLVDFVGPSGPPGAEGPTAGGDHTVAAMIGYLLAAGGRQRPARLVSAQVLDRLRPVQLAEHFRMEAATNEILGALAATVLCVYDAGELEADALLAARQTHPGLAGPGALVTSADFRPAREYVRHHSAVVGPPPSAPSIGCDSTERLAVARMFVRDQAEAAGLRPRATQDVVLAVGELLSNAIVHGRAPRRVWAYREKEEFVFHVHDSGPGFTDPLEAYLPPLPGASPGRGLWTARQMGEALEVGGDGTGTHVRLLVAMTDPAAP